MYAIVEIAGKQYKVKEGQEIFVDFIDGKSGDKVTFEQVLLTDNNGSVQVGTPTLGVNVSSTILSHVKDDKVIVFKKKRRKGYKVKNGHRQQYTKLSINKIA